ncbi:MAG TPA: alkaline phosphatase D family protein [Azospirillaceae bacterium]|nr:alkaline phosphatase D family protein [Azospirillaceae bacterium]
MARPPPLARALAIGSTLLALLLSGGPASAQQVLAQPAPVPLTRIAFGSCADQERPQPIWQAVLAYKPELFIFAGDNVYGSVRREKLTPRLGKLRRAYTDAARVDGIRRMREAAEIMAVWDDHDFGLNDGGADHPFRAEAKALFMDFWRLAADDPRRGRDGLYHARIFGPEGARVQVILLDTRWFRSPLAPTDQSGAPGKERYVPDPDPAKTMLGEVQWLWLAEQLRQPAELRLVVSSVQVLAEGHGWERWGNFPRERQRLFDLIRETGANGVVFLSGDRHLGGLYRETTGTPYPMLDVTSSGISHAGGGRNEITGPNRLGDAYRDENFGTVDVDWAAGTVTLSVRGMDGAAVLQTSIGLAELTGQGPSDGR